ncbi:MAG TPA: hypothetical protein P5183_10930 [Smithellaceae bacterium]|nr:hypothetical protein [Smithellaceae bacterium]
MRLLHFVRNDKKGNFIARTDLSGRSDLLHAAEIPSSLTLLGMTKAAVAASQ